MNEAQANNSYPRPCNGVTAREVLAAVAEDHRWHTVVDHDVDAVVCSCGARLLVTEEAAERLKLEHLQVMALLRLRVPKRVQA